MLIDTSHVSVETYQYNFLREHTNDAMFLYLMLSLPREHSKAPYIIHPNVVPPPKFWIQ
jgi:hypothetical protein